MKKTTSTGNRTTRNSNSQNMESGSQSAKALRTVGDKEAFYFYEAIGKPTGQNAKNLNDFMEKVKTIKAESLAFHVQRKDFQNWAEKILGDAKLARELGRFRPKQRRRQDAHLRNRATPHQRTQTIIRGTDRIRKLGRLPAYYIKPTIFLYPNHARPYQENSRF